MNDLKIIIFLLSFGLFFPSHLMRANDKLSSRTVVYVVAPASAREQDLMQQRSTLFARLSSYRATGCCNSCVNKCTISNKYCVGILCLMGTVVAAGCVVAGIVYSHNPG